jgi:hypothetical protein
MKECTKPGALFVLAFTGVPIRRLNDFPCSGRWDEVYRCLLAIKQLGTHARCVLLLECAEDGVHQGVASLALSDCQLATLVACDESGFVNDVFPRLVRDVTTERTAEAALLSGLRFFFNDADPPFRVQVSCFASPDDEVVKKFDGVQICRPCVECDCDLVVKIFGSPCHWAHGLEMLRFPLLVRCVADYFSLRSSVSIVHLGRTRFRASTCMLVPDGVRVYVPSQKSVTIPRVAFFFTFEEPMSDRRAAEYLHHFVVEILWTERRRDQPRHHVTVKWRADCQSEWKMGSVSSLQLENLRGDRERKTRLREKFRIKET